MENIANADETGKFFKVLTNKTMHLKGDRCHGGKSSKERITLPLTVFADGTFGKPVIIGKSNNARCFKHSDKERLPVLYQHNAKAWMTSALFKEYLHKINQQMVREGRKILLFVDNAECHAKIQMSNVQLEYFPPNCSSVSVQLHSTDSGIINCIKVHYRKIMLKIILAFMETCDKSSDLVKKTNVLDAIMMISKSIKEVKPVSVRKCFKNCGFPVQEVNDECHVIDDSQEIDEREEINELQKSKSLRSRKFANKSN